MWALSGGASARKTGIGILHSAGIRRGRNNRETDIPLFLGLAEDKTSYLANPNDLRYAV